MGKKSTRQSVVALYRSLVNMNLKWTYLYKCFCTAPHHSPSYLSSFPHKHTPSRVARILWERLVLQSSQLFPGTELWLLWRGFLSWCFRVVLAGSGDVCEKQLHKHSQGEAHQYRILEHMLLGIDSFCVFHRMWSVSFTFVSFKLHWPGDCLAFMALRGAKRRWWYQLLFTPSSAQRSKWCCGFSHGAEHQTCLVVNMDFDLTRLGFSFFSTILFFIWKTWFAQFRKHS